ncbi:MAG: membrane protein insertase YidC [Spirochaetes bacterium]|jgi:YidC/Oxa1 family membrane protein insertase|nr:membrane protein insertase YidC [Spirochaetota bacterium]
MEKRTLIAIVLTALIWLGWFIIFKPEQEVKKQPEAQATKEAESKEKPRVDKAGPEAAVKIARVAGAKETELKILTDIYDITLSSKGGSIKSMVYRERNIQLVVNKNGSKTRPEFDFPVSFNEDDFMKGNGLEDAVWTMAQTGPLTVKFSTRVNVDAIPVELSKIYEFNKKGHDIRLSYVFRNLGNREIPLGRKPVIISPADMLGPELDYTNTYNRLTSIFSLDGSYKQSEKGEGFFSKYGPIKREAGKIEWSGIMSRYFLIIMIPQGFTGTEAIHDNREGTGLRTGMKVEIGLLKPNQEVKKPFRVYIGEKNKDMLAAVDKSIVDASDVSKWIEPIRFVLMWCLLHINKLIGNLGWSLVIFSLITKIIFMPLTMKSNESMKKMQQLTPKLNAIKEKYKDKPEVLQREMMKVYKENKVNPMGGCFPMLLQMPFFFALYSALINSIDLWNAPFIFWMKDLSMPDTVARMFGYNLNILPLLMTATTFLQQKLSTVDTGTQQQKMMLYTMPLVFIFIFWNMPSGLVLYWALQNVFQIMHQLYINKRAKQKEATS